MFGNITLFKAVRTHPVTHRPGFVEHEVKLYEFLNKDDIEILRDELYVKLGSFLDGLAEANYTEKLLINRLADVKEDRNAIETTYFQCALHYRGMTFFQRLKFLFFPFPNYYDTNKRYDENF